MAKYVNWQVRLQHSSIQKHSWIFFYLVFAQLPTWRYSKLLNLFCSHNHKGIDSKLEQKYEDSSVATVLELVCQDPIFLNSKTKLKSWSHQLKKRPIIHSRRESGNTSNHQMIHHDYLSFHYVIQPREEYLYEKKI